MFNVTSVVTYKLLLDILISNAQLLDMFADYF